MRPETVEPNQGGIRIKSVDLTADTGTVVRRIFDLLLIAAILCAVGFGAYEVGHHVDSTSNTLAQQDSELGQKVYRPANASGPSKHTVELIGISVAGAAGIMIVVSLASSLLRTRKRQRWHAT